MFSTYITKNDKMRSVERQVGFLSNEFGTWNKVLSNHGPHPNNEGARP